MLFCFFLDIIKDAFHVINIKTTHPLYTLLLGIEALMGCTLQLNGITRGKAAVLNIITMEECGPPLLPFPKKKPRAYSLNMFRVHFALLSHNCCALLVTSIELLVVKKRVLSKFSLKKENTRVNNPLPRQIVSPFMKPILSPPYSAVRKSRLISHSYCEEKIV